MQAESVRSRRNGSDTALAAEDAAQDSNTATFALLAFDDEGCFDAKAFDRRQLALAELALSPQMSEPRSAATVVDAASRFVAHGARWTPSGTLARLLDSAALGQTKFQRL